MVKRDGQWHEVDWEQAFDVAGRRTSRASFGVLASPHSTLEELFLVAKLGAVADFRLRHSDFSADGKREGMPWLGMPVAELQQLDRVLVVGSFLRKDHPLIAHRLRQAAKRGAQIHMLHSVDDDWLMPIASKKIVAAVGHRRAPLPRSRRCSKAGKNAAVFLGNFAQQHPQAAQIHAAAQALAASKVGILGEAANSVGGYLAGLPDARQRCATCSSRRTSCCSTSSRSSTAPTRAARCRRCKDARVRGEPHPVEDQRSSTPTCCCRSRPSPRPRAPSSTPKAGCRASTPR